MKTYYQNHKDKENLAYAREMRRHMTPGGIQALVWFPKSIPDTPCKTKAYRRIYMDFLLCQRKNSSSSRWYPSLYPQTKRIR